MFKLLRLIEDPYSKNHALVAAELDTTDKLSTAGKKKYGNRSSHTIVRFR